MTKAVPQQADFIVVGAGVAGLRAAVELADAGRVLVLAKQELSESATQYAQGGIAVALSDEDDISIHLQDTLDAGDGLCHVEAVKVLVQEGPERIQELIDWGTQFDRKGTKLTFAREGAHTRSRILHAHGDSTGREIARALQAKAHALKSISFCDFEFTSNLLMESGGVSGVELVHAGGRPKAVKSSAVLLATGGIGQVYRETTNPSVATADGVAMAYRAGAEISDLEFVQFHPTALYVKGAPRFLLSEALRGEGACLRNMQLQRFMPKYHEQAELAPRDVVSRAIVHEIEVVGTPEAVVYLDLTHLKSELVIARFPRIYETCMRHNIDITGDLIPVRPAAHYAMGGVRTDLDGKTSLPGLYAAGEVAGTGVHGANRLASNSLLEGIVFGARAGKAMKTAVQSRVEHSDNRHSGSHAGAAAPPPSKNLQQLVSEVRGLMWNEVGIVRTGSHLKRAVHRLAELQAQLLQPHSRLEWEAVNMVQSGLLIARLALAREESRGAHYRIDFPIHNDLKLKKHSVMAAEKIRFE